MNSTSEQIASSTTLISASTTVVGSVESSSQAPVKPQQSRPGLIAGSVIGALFMVIVFGVITVMHIRERKKRISALKAEKQARIEAGKSGPHGETHHDQAIRELEEGNGHFGSGLHA